MKKTGLNRSFFAWYFLFLSGAGLLNLWKRPDLGLQAQELAILLIGALVLLVGLTGLSIHKPSSYVRTTHFGPPILLDAARVLVTAWGGISYLLGLLIITASFALVNADNGWWTVATLFRSFVVISLIAAPLFAICSFCQVQAKEDELPETIYILPWFDYRS